MKKIIFASFLWLVLISLVIAYLIDMTYMETITTIKDIILAICAVVGACVAYRGLGTWQRQLKGQVEYDLSRRLLIGLFKYRDAINGVRNSITFSYEMPDPPEEQAKNMNQDQIKFYRLAKAYGVKWDRVIEQKTLLYADRIEAEAIWGSDLNNLFNNIFKLENELFEQIRHYLEIMNPDVSAPSKVASYEYLNSKRDIKYDSSYYKTDDYKQDLITAIAEIESYLKPKLRHDKL